MDAGLLPWSGAVRAPIEASVTVNGVSLTYFEWGRGLGGDPILLVHATGFHARTWDQVVAHLGRRRIVAIDQRGHGRSDKVERIRWQEFGRDVAEVVRRLDLHGVVGVGHSAGGHALVEAAAREPARFRRLVLVDPTILAPEMYAPRGSDGDGAWIEVAGNAHPAAKRRRFFESIDDMVERLRARPSFATFTTGALRDYCTWGLLPCADPTGFELACSPEMEGAVYTAAFGNPAIHDHVEAVTVPVTLLRAMEPPTPADLADFRNSPTWPALATRFRDARDVQRPDRTHFLPMEDPALVASLVSGDDQSRA
jgi:pimeloyl-ACP methyl ester carboxylesterase